MCTGSWWRIRHRHSLGRLCDELEFSFSSGPGGNPTLIVAKKEDHPVLYGMYILPVAVTQQQINPSARHDPARSALVPDTEVKEPC